MKKISDIIRCLEHLLGFGSKEEKEVPLVNTTVDIIPQKYDTNQEEQSLDVPPPLESGIINIERTHPLSLDENIHNSLEPENRCDLSEKECATEETLDPIERNEQFEGLLENICLAMDFFDDKSDNFANQSGDKVYKFIRLKLIDRLLLSGASLIKDEESFDLLRHKPLDFQKLPEEGCCISQTLSPGVEYGNKVYLKAVVKLKE